MTVPPARKRLLFSLVLAGAMLATVGAPQSQATAAAPAAAAGTDCDALWRTRMALWIKYRRCFNDPKARALPGATDCHRTRDEALMTMSGPDHARLELYQARAAELGCTHDD
ncbi:MAG: hypothetical protein GC150_07205 [Rhizobiales bacterium]|nr:hypothetical protein [Hyphomicrobiales bacterium]